MDSHGAQTKENLFPVMRWVIPSNEILTPAFVLLLVVVCLVSAHWSTVARLLFMVAAGALLTWLIIAVTRVMTRQSEMLRAARECIEKLTSEARPPQVNPALAGDYDKLCEELRSAVRDREELLAVISHEIKNSLALVDVYASLALRQMGPDAMAGLVQREHLVKIQSAKERMNRLITDLLDLEKINAGTFTPNRQPESVVRLLRKSVEAFEPLAALKSLKIIQSYPKHDRLFNLDHEGVFRIMTNLLLNAAKFAPEGGVVRITGSFAESNLIIRIADNGPGIAEEHLSHVFDRLWQAKNTATLGSGLGLAIVRGIVSAHGGNVVASNDPAGGAVFTVTLPSGN